MTHIFPSASPPRDSSGRFGGHGAYRSRSSAPATLFTPLSASIDRLHAALGDAIDVLTATGEAAENAPVPVAMLAASPGAGKSRVARELLAERMEGQAVTFHAPTLALVAEAAAHARELGTDTEIIRGRSAPDPDQDDLKMCRKADLVERGVRLGLRIHESFCQSSSDPEQRCVFFDSCAYNRQFSPSSGLNHRYMATRYLGFPDPTDANPALRVVDETFWAQQLSSISILAESFTLPRTFLRTRDRGGKRHDALVARQADLLTAARAVVDHMSAGKSPLELDYSAEDYRGLAQLEYRAHAPDPALRPDQSTACQDRFLSQAEQNARHVSWFAAVWICLADAKQKGRTTTERLRLERRRDSLTLRLQRKHGLQHREPMLLLDADADTEILTALGCDIRHTSHMLLRPNANVVQIHDRRMTHGSLLNGRELREAWRHVVIREVLRDRLERGGGVLVGASRKVILSFFQDAGHDFTGKTDDYISNFMLNNALHGAHWLWFGGRALGSNRYRDCSSVIVIGREELPVTVLEDYGRALWGDRPDADLAFLEAGEDGLLRLPQIETPYEMKNGETLAVLVPCHPDPLIRRVQRQTRELATRQLVERLRLARTATPKRVILGCNIPIPGLPVDRLVSWDAYKPKRHEAALFEGLARQGGLRLSASGLFEDAPDVFPTVDAAKAYLKRNRTRPADLLEGLPASLTPWVRQVALRQERPYARDVFAIVLADSDEEAFQQTRKLWGPLKHCSVHGGGQKRRA